MNKYLVIKKDQKIVGVKEYIKENNSEFSSFIQREVFPDEYSVDNSGQKPAYMEFVNKMGFHWDQNADRGHVQYDYKAKFIMSLIQEYARNLVHEIGFPVYEVSGANMFDVSHPVVQAYAELYGDRLYRIPSGKSELVMSYDGSYPQFNLAQSSQLSEKHLPFGHFSLADCYRHEQSGECMLLFRQRRFYMPDIHPYFKNLNEAFDWFPKMEEKILEAGRCVNYEYHIVIEVASEKNWQEYQDKIIEVAKNLKRDVLINIINDGKDRYWIINVDYKLLDKLGQSREIACVQIDVGNASRLGIEYIDQSGKKQNPSIIHSAIPGGIERYLYLMFDDFKNRFPLWLHPAQIRLIPVSDEYIDLCEKYRDSMKNRKVRIEIDDRSVPVGKRIKMAYSDLIPFPILIGEQEKESCPALNNAVEEIEEASQEKPFKQFLFPYRLDQRI